MPINTFHDCTMPENVQYFSKTVGFIAGSFDILHPGYIAALGEAKTHCDYLIVGLHTDPSEQRSHKFKPVCSATERTRALLSLKFVDIVIPYKTEQDLYNILKNNDISVRFLGDDYIDKETTGDDLNIKIIYLSRDHGWSYSKLRKLILENTKATK